MALIMIPGNSGGGKTTYLYQRILEEARKNPSVSYLVIVPEQFTLETQRDLVRMHPGHSLCSVDILSFQRLAHRLLEEAGRSERTVLDDTGKNFLIRRIAEKHRSQLKMLGGSLDRMGYIDEIKSFLSEMMQYDLSPDDLVRMEEEAQSTSLKWKLEDLELIYRSFLEETKDRYSTSEGILAEVGGLAADSALLQGAVVAFDGFTGFTPVQVRLLREIMHRAKDVYVTLTIDGREPLLGGGKPKMEELFYLSRRTAKMLVSLAEETGQEVEEPIWQCGSGKARFRNSSALYHLEQNLFRRKPGEHLLTKEEKDQIRIQALPNPLEELRAAASKIRELVEEGGYHYGDFAVVTGAPDNYEPYVERIFGELGVPYFMDRTRRILYHPFVDLIRSLFQMLIDDFSYRSVFACLRSGYFSFEEDEIDRMDNYVLATGIRGWSMWEKPWRRTAGIYSADELKSLNELRRRFRDEIADFREKCRLKGSVLQKSAALYQLLNKLDAASKIEESSRLFLEEKDAVRSRENEQIYRLVMEILEKLTSLLGEQELTAREYLDLLEAGFSASPMRVAPPQEDVVLIGDIERTRLTHIRGLFLIGANDGILPNLTGSGGILSELERRSLKEQGEELAYSAREQALLQNFYLYQNLTKPQEFLYITWSGMGMDADALRKSFLVPAVERLFPNLKEEKRLSGEGSLLTPEASFLRYAHKTAAAMDSGEPDEEWKALSVWYGTSEKWRGKAERIRSAAAGIYSDRSLSEQTADSLYGKILRGSISRLEQFASCPCSYFLKYGLLLEERRTAGFEASDRGSLFHQAICLYTRRVKELEMDFHSLSEEKVNHLADLAMDAALAASEYESLEDEASGEETYRAMKRIFRRTAQTVTKQIQAGTFEPIFTEKEFELPVDLGGGRKMKLRGVADRLDEADTEDGKLLRIIDYKSSPRELKLDEYYYGLNLQLFLYMYAALQEQSSSSECRISPAGVFYYAMNDPEISIASESQEAGAEDAVEDKLRMTGLLKDSEEVITAMDRTPDLKKSKVVPLTLKKDGTVNERSSSVVSEKDFDALVRFSEKKAKKLGNQILQGDVQAAPYRKSSSTGCDYCPYRSVCGFDRRIDGYEYRMLGTEDKEEILEQIRKEEKE